MGAASMGSRGSSGGMSMGGMGSSSGMSMNRSSGMGISAGQRTMMGSNRRMTMDQMISQAGLLSGNERFMNRQPGTFVGGDASSVQGVLSGMYASPISQGQQNRFQTMRTQPVRQPRQQSMTGGVTGPQFRAALAPDIAHPSIDTDAIGPAVLKRMRSSPYGVKTQSPLEIAVVGQTATLRGEVASERDRLLAEQLVRLEPGVWQIKNELVVNPAAAAKAETPAPPPAAPSVGKQP